MTKQPFIILFCGFITSIIVVSMVHAFAKGNVDGQWSCIEPENDTCGTAANDCWASGPEGGSTAFDDFDSIKLLEGFFSPQSSYILGLLYDDWNQVRYGGFTVADIEFLQKSGFGFDGVNNNHEPLTPDLGVPFLLGKFCHFNNPIETDDEMEWVDLNIRVDGIQCDALADDTYPDPDGILNFAYRFTLDETPNSSLGEDCGGVYSFCPYTIGTDTYCPYDSGVNSLGCADKIEIDVLPPTDIFTCYYDGSARHYTISILGLIPLSDSTETCPAEPNGDHSFTLISREEAYNCACLYGSFTEVGVTAVELISFTAVPSKEGVLIEWETATEVDNLGFNLYREDLQTGMKVKINPELIPSKLPGSTQGAQYEFWDQAVIFGEPCAYWLEDIDLHMRVKDQYGPVNPLWWHFFMPILSVGR